MIDAGLIAVYHYVGRVSERKFCSDGRKQVEMFRAPRGGSVSPVNGQRYEGGEFMPDHGLFAGQLKRRAARHAADVGEFWAELRVAGSDRHGWFLFKRLAGESRERMLDKRPLKRHADAIAFAVAIVEQRDERYRQQHVVPHPTRIFG